MTEQKHEFVAFEKLDALMAVTDPKGWLSLLGASFLIVVGILWLFLGKIPSKVNGTGMLINSGGIETITANVSGQITRFDIKVGDHISKDQPIAYISQFLLQSEIRNAKQKIADQISINENKEVMRKNIQEKYQDEIIALRNKLAAQERLLKSGLIIERDSLETKQQITQSDKRLEETKIDKMTDENILSNLKRELHILENRYETDSVIRSPYNGRVFELGSQQGDVVNTQTTLLLLESTNAEFNKLQAYIYVSAFESKKIMPGMTTSIIPTTVKPEEYGSIQGKVISISAYPTTFKGIMRVLHNEEMAKQILAKQSQVEVVVELITDEKTFSKLKWTTKEGPPIQIQSGTLCNAKITVKEKRPIELLIPKVKEIFMVNE